MYEVLKGEDYFLPALPPPVCRDGFRLRYHLDTKMRTKRKLQMSIISFS